MGARRRTPSSSAAVGGVDVEVELVLGGGGRLVRDTGWMTRPVKGAAESRGTDWAWREEGPMGVGREREAVRPAVR